MGKKSQTEILKELSKGALKGAANELKNKPFTELLKKDEKKTPSRAAKNELEVVKTDKGYKINATPEEMKNFIDTASALKQQPKKKDAEIKTPAATAQKQIADFAKNSVLQKPLITKPTSLKNKTLADKLEEAEVKAPRRNYTQLPVIETKDTKIGKTDYKIDMTKEELSFALPQIAKKNEAFNSYNEYAKEQRKNNKYWGMNYTQLKNEDHEIRSKLRNGEIIPEEARLELNSIAHNMVKHASDDELLEMLEESKHREDATFNLLAGHKNQLSYDVNNNLMGSEKALRSYIKRELQDREIIKENKKKIKKWQNGLDLENSDYEGYSNVLDSAFKENEAIYHFVNSDKYREEYRRYEYVDYKELGYHLLTDEEKKTFNAVWNQKGQEEARKFLKDMEKELNRRAANEEAQKAAEWAEEHKVLGSIKSIGQRAVSGIGAVENLIEGIIKKDIDPYDSTGRIANTASAARQAVSQKIAMGSGGKAGAFLYDIGMSIADFVVSTVLFKGAGSAAGASAKLTNSLATLNMSLSSSADAMIDAANRGGNDWQIALSGIASGVAEFAFEKISIEKLFSDPKLINGKNLRKFIGQQIVTEGSEEGLTEIANIIADAVIMGGRSTNALKIENYMLNGMSYEEASRKVFKENVVQIAMSTAGGMISGAALGGAVGSFNYLGTQSDIKARGNDVLNGKDSANDINLIVEAGLEYEKNSDIYKQAEKIKNKKASGKTISEQDIGTLTYLMENENNDNNADIDEPDVNERTVDNADRVMFSHIMRDYNVSKRETLYKYVGKTSDNRKIYKSNYPTNTPKSVKQTELISLVQNAWSKKDIELTLNTGEKIKVKFDPELSERSDLSKIAFGNRKGNGSEKRITSNLFPDLYEIAEDSTHTYGKGEEHRGKENNPAHNDVKRWEYFVTNLIYEEDDGTQIDCYMNIDVKRTTDGNYFYSFAIEKGTAPQTLLAVVTEQSSATDPSNNNIPYGKTAVNTYSMPKNTNNSQSPLPQAIVEGNKTTEALYRDASLVNISLQLAKMGYLESDLKDVAQTLVNYANGKISAIEVEKILSIPQADAIAQMIEQDANLRELIADPKAQSVASGETLGNLVTKAKASKSEAELFRSEIDLFYAAGKNNISYAEVERMYSAKSLSSDERMAAYYRGLENAQRVYTFKNGNIVEKKMNGNIKGGLLVNDGARRLTNIQKRYLMKLGETLNKTITIQDNLRNSDGQRVSGFINDTAVFIDASVKDPIMWTATHEFSHQMQKLAPKEWAKYRAYVIKIKEKNGTYDEDLETYESAYGKISETELQDEMACDYTDQLFKNEKDLLDFINKARSLATKVKNIWFKVLDKLNISYKEDARSLWEKCYKEATSRAKKGENGASGDVRYKIITMSDGSGRKYVHATGKVIRSKNPDDWETEIIDYVNRCVRKGNDVEIPLDNEESIFITEKTAWKLGYRNGKNEGRPIGDKFYMVKGNASGVIDEIISISKYDNYKLPYEEHSDGFAKFGFDYRTAYFMDLDGKYYKLTLSVGINEDGKVAYNIGKIEEKTFPVSGSKAQGNKTQGKSSPKNRVPHKNGSVKNYSMQNGGNNSQNGRSRISSAAEATRKNRESTRAFEKLSGAIEQMKGKSDGGIVVNEHSIALKKRDITSYVGIQNMAQDLGMKAIIVKGLFEDSEQALDGIITPQGVFIDADAENPARFVATHEFSHRMKQAAAKEWKRYQDYVIKVLKEKKLTGTNKTSYDVLYEATRNAYGNKTDDYIHEEIAANHIGELFENEAELIDFIRTDRSLAQKVRAWWNNVLSMFGFNGEKEKVKAMWLRAYKKAVSNVQSGKVGAFSEEVRYRIGHTNKNNPVVMLEEDIFEGKEGKPHTIIAEYIAEHIGECYRIIESGQKVYIGEDLPGEFTQSKYTTEFLRKRRNLLKAKNQSTQNLKEIIEIATDRKWEKSTKEKHKVDAKYGFYKYKSMIATPKYDSQKNIVGSNLYEIELLIRNDADGKKYLYDIQDINKIERSDEQLSSTWDIRSDSQYPSLLDKSVPHKEGSVNSHSMQNNGNNSQEGRKSIPGTRLSDLVEKYGAIEPGAEPRRDVSVPKRTEKNNRVRQFARTAAEATTLSDEVADRVLDGVADGKFSYTPVSNDGALGEANASYDMMGQEWCEREVMGKVQAHNLDKKTIALAEVLLQKYSENGEVEKANELIIEIAAEGTRMGQSIQALSMLKKLSDNYEIKYVDKVIEKLKEDVLKRYKGKKSADIELSDEVRNQIMSAKTQEEKNMARERAFEEIASQLPQTWEMKWNAWRYIAMLANTRTHIRNFVGNAFFMPMIATKNVAGAIFEGVIDKISSEGIERTKALVIPKEYREFAKNDLSEVEDILTGGGKNNVSSAIQDKQKVFNIKFFEWLRVTNEKLLNKEDLVFLKHHYKNAFAGYLAANKVQLDNIDERTLTRARNYALRQAQMATYRDMNAFSSAVSKLNRVDNKGLRLVIEGVIPFKKTPANILVRGLEYSPAGLVKAMWNGATKLRKGQMTSSEFIEELSAGLTGTGVVVLGAMLSSLGLIVGAPEDDELKEFEELQGKQSYALVIGDHSYTIDWLAPLALPLFVGVELQRLFEKRGDLEAKDYYNAITNLLEPMFELSMLSGLSDTISTIGTASSSEMSRSILEKTVTGYFGQAVPTMFGQIARIIDDTTRKSYYDKNSALPKFAQYFAQSQMKKIPGMSNKLEPYVDEWGREKVMGNIFVRVLQNFFSPGYYSKIKSSGMEEELKRLFVESNGEYKVFPRAASKEFKLDNGETLMLSAEEYTQMQKVQGRTAYDILSSVMDSGVYDLLEYDSYKAKLVGSVYELSSAKARKEVAGEDYSADKWIEEALQMDDDELNDYLVLRVLKNNEFGGKAAPARKYASENLDNLSEEFWLNELSDVSDKRRADYETFIRDTGISAEDYMQMYDYYNSLKVINKDQPNEIGKIDQMADYLNKTDLSLDTKMKIGITLGGGNWSEDGLRRRLTP